MDSNIKGQTFTSRVCYICLSADNDNKLTSITEDIWKMYQFVTEITVLHNEIIQPNMCGSCIMNITQFAEFKRKCMKSYSFWENVRVTSNNTKKQTLKHDIIENCVKEELLNDIEDDDDDDIYCDIKLEVSPNENEITNKCNKYDEELKKTNIIDNDIRKNIVNLQCNICQRQFKYRKSYLRHLNMCDKRLKTSPKNIVEILNPEAHCGADEEYIEETCNDIKLEVIENKIEKNEELKKANIKVINSEIKRKCVSMQCNKCQRKFTYRKTYLGHIKLCRKVLKTSLKNTIETLNPEECTNCGHCDITFKDLKLLKNHLDSLKEEVQCTLCDFKAIDYAMLIAHRYHHLPENYSIFCHTCSKTFYVRLGLEYHYRSIHLHKNANICLRCNKEYSSYRMWRRHALHHEWRYQCDQCSARFWHKYDIVNHVQSHMYGHRYICDICGYSTGRMRNLRSHKDAKHTKYEPVTCDLCHITLKNERSLLRHTRMQHTVNVYCSVCSKGFVSEKVLQSHMIWHGDIRPYKCDTCFKAFKTKSSLKEHLRTHTREKIHECNVCHARLSASSSLRRHKKMHTKDVVK